SNLEFKIGSITEIPIKGEHLFDMVVCFEALEHVENHEKLLSEVKRLIVPDGLFLVSTPNKRVYTDEPHFNNPYHVHELYFDEFKAGLERHFRQVKILGQRIYCNSNIWPIYPEKSTHSSEFLMEKTPQEFIFVDPEKRTPIYFLAVASNSAEEIGAHASMLVDISNELVSQKEHAINRVEAERDELKSKVSFWAGERTQLQARAKAQQQLITQRQELISRLNEGVAQRDRDKATLNEIIRQKDNRFAEDVAWL